MFHWLHLYHGGPPFGLPADSPRAQESTAVSQVVRQKGQYMRREKSTSPEPRAWLLHPDISPGLGRDGGHHRQ